MFLLLLRSTDFITYHCEAKKQTKYVGTSVIFLITILAFPPTAKNGVCKLL